MQSMYDSHQSAWLMITGGDVVLPDATVLYGGTVVIRHGVIHQILPEPPASLLFQEENVSVVDATGCWLTPGLIDQHLHGAFGIDFNQSSIEEMHQLLLQLPQHGVTGLVPTLITAPKLEMVTALTRLEEVIHTATNDQARVLGIHLEGPFLSEHFRGAHPAAHLLAPEIENLEGLLSPSLLRMTIAPELSGAIELIEHMCEKSILCSIGHSGANAGDSLDAIRAGAGCATHLFNAMGPFDHRQPGIAIVSLIDDALCVEVIADGKHLSPLVLALVLKAKPVGKTILISDCNALAGLKPGASVQFGNQTVKLSEHGAVNEEGRLAGSADLITDGVRNLVRWGIATFPEAIGLATTNPAYYLCQTPRQGHLTEGAIADIVLWNPSDLSIQSVYLRGQAAAMEFVS